MARFFQGSAKVTNHLNEIHASKLPERVAQALDACKPLSDAQRIALAILLVGNTNDAHCAQQLDRLSAVCVGRANELRRIGKEA